MSGGKSSISDGNVPLCPGELRAQMLVFVDSHEMASSMLWASSHYSRDTEARVSSWFRNEADIFVQK
jgi:hypothetical protein